MAAAQPAQVRHLFRSILRLHKALPPVMRQLGDRVLREEWRAMLAAERKGKASEAQWREQWREFAAQWRLYADELQAGRLQAEVRPRRRAPRRRAQQLTRAAARSKTRRASCWRCRCRRS
jgi:hypothetical protein